MSIEPATPTPAMLTESSSAYTLTPTGIEFHGELTGEEWEQLGHRLGQAGRSVGFLIGDWLVYGDGKGPRFYGAEEGQNVYTKASAITKLDYGTLSNFAAVSRKVKFPLRSGNLSFEHHKKVAYLKKPEDQERWLKIAETQGKDPTRPMSARRLAKSICANRIVSPDELTAKKGRPSLTLHANRLFTFWNKQKKNGWLETADSDFIQAAIEDLQPVVGILNELKAQLKVVKELEAEEDALEVDSAA